VSHNYGHDQIGSQRPLAHELRKVLTLFAGFAIGIHIAVFLHELGHALGYWISGGSVIAIVMNAPAPTGHVVGGAQVRGPYTWGGVVFGSLCAVFPLALSRYLARSSATRFTALMVAAFCLAHNGLYLFVGGILPFGDAIGMIELGAPHWLLIVLGMPLLAAFIFVLASAIQGVGPDPAISLWKWLIIVELGLFPVPALTLMPLLSPTASRNMQASMLLYAATYAACFALAGYRAWLVAQTRKADDESTRMCESWKLTIRLFAVAFLLIAVEWIAFRPA
jgi:hypothetical protein